MDSVEQQAIWDYCQGADQRTNGALISGRTPAIAAALDKALSQVRSAETRTLYRAIFCSPPAPGLSVDQQMARTFPIGSVIDTPGYLAVATRRQLIEISDPGCTIVMELRTAAGAALGDRAAGVVLLPRQSRWRVIGHRSAAGSEHRVPTIHVVPDAAVPGADHRLGPVLSHE